jgi:hypothetical protein
MTACICLGWLGTVQVGEKGDEGVLRSVLALAEVDEDELGGGCPAYLRGKKRETGVAPQPKPFT